MASPSATYEEISRGARAGRRDGAATKSVATDASRRHGSATARRAQPTRRGPIPVSRARSIMVAPVVPHEIEASPTSSKPISMVSAVYESHDVGMRNRQRAGGSKGSSGEAAPEGCTRGVLPVRPERAAEGANEAD